jgi:hypothetical protein
VFSEVDKAIKEAWLPLLLEALELVLSDDEDEEDEEEPPSTPVFEELFDDPAEFVAALGAGGRRTDIANTGPVLLPSRIVLLSTLHLRPSTFVNVMTFTTP